MAGLAVIPLVAHTRWYLDRSYSPSLTDAAYLGLIWLHLRLLYQLFYLSFENGFESDI